MEEGSCVAPSLRYVRVKVARDKRPGWKGNKKSRTQGYLREKTPPPRENQYSDNVVVEALSCLDLRVLALLSLSWRLHTLPHSVPSSFFFSPIFFLE